MKMGLFDFNNDLVTIVLCKDCNSICDHAGTDFVLVCMKGASCKTVKPKPETVAVIRCRDCVHDGLVTCPIYYIKKHDPDFFCAYGERGGVIG